MFKYAIAGFAVMAVPLLLAAPAHAAQDEHMVTAQLSPLNGTSASGTAEIMWSDGQAEIEIRVSGVLADAPHAQHIHLVDSGDGMCPTADADQDGDGIVNTPEGQPAYGPIAVSLTTDGDTSPDSGLAVDRMPAADGDGTYSYHRTIDLPAEVAERLADGVVVVHGIDTINPSGEYDGEPMSELDPELPLEATAPAACGALAQMPADGGDMGDGTTGGPQSMVLFGFGGAALAVAAGLAIRQRHHLLGDQG